MAENFVPCGERLKGSTTPSHPHEAPPGCGGFGEFWFRAGTCMAVEGDQNGDAEKYLKYAVLLNETNAEAWNNLGNVYRATGNVPEVMSGVERSVHPPQAGRCYKRAASLDRSAGAHRASFVTDRCQTRCSIRPC